eukprot:6480877-Amphidinium_carterae.2
MPELAYEVSWLQQHSKGASTTTLLKANAVLKKAKQMREQEVCIVYRKFDCAEPLFVGIHDASFCQEPGYKSQRGYVGMVTTMEAIRDPCQYHPAHVLEWESATLKRVMRSTLACEAASASLAYDRNCYMRAITAMAKGHT